jgi:arsenite methyltransferase
MSHERIASTFDEWARNGHGERLEHAHGDVVRQVIERMEIKAGMLTLDLGCGTGWATRQLASMAPGAGAVGVDVSPEMIAKAEALHDLTSRARYERGTFEALDFPDGRFHRAFSMEALYYAVDLPLALGELQRVLRPGAVAHLVVDRFRESPHTESWTEMVGLDMHYLSEAEWRTALDSAGFEGVQAERVIDSRGPGDEASFEPDAHTPDWTTRVELHGAGSLWLRASKPS